MNVIYRATVGSRMHGLHTAESDYDYRDVFMLDLKSLLSPFGQTTHKRMSENGEDVEAFELRHFLKLLTSGNPTVYEILWSPQYEMDPAFKVLKDNKHWFLNTKTITASHIGYADSQVGKYLQKAIEDPSILQQENAVRRMKKAAVAGVRVLHQAMQLLDHGDFKPRIADYDPVLAKRLLEIKYMPDEEVDVVFLESNLHWIEALKNLVRIKECNVLANGTVYTPDYNAIEETLVRIYSNT